MSCKAAQRAQSACDNGRGRLGAAAQFEGNVRQRSAFEVPQADGRALSRRQRFDCDAKLLVRFVAGSSDAGRRLIGRTYAIPLRAALGGVI
jgi:hypothetical protein